MVNAQEWLDKKYPKEQRANITDLNISDKGLEGKLKLENFSNLVYLNCFDNQLTEIDFSSLKPEKTKILNIANNNLCSQDLTLLDKFVNLEELYIHNNNQNKIDKGIINRWHGSLEPLKNMNKLKRLEISQTDLESGLEYLPESLEIIWCYYGQRPSSLCRSMYEQLKNCESLGHQDFRIWKATKQTQELSNFLFSDQPYNFTKFKKELIRLKHLELASQVKEAKVKFEQLIIDAKTKINAYEQTNQDAEYENHASLLQDLLDNQETLTTYQDLSNIKPRQIQTVEKQLQWAKSSLMHILNIEELNQICQTKAEAVKLELQLEQSEQTTEQVAQIQQNYSPKK